MHIFFLSPFVHNDLSVAGTSKALEAEIPHRGPGLASWELPCLGMLTTADLT